MARIIAPNKQYAGVSAGVPFTGGEGHTDNEYLINAIAGALSSADGAFKISIDAESRYPIVAFYEADSVEFVTKGRKVTAVKFYTPYKVEQKEYRLEEEYGTGYVRYRLFSEDGRQVDMSEVEEIAGLKDTSFNGDFMMAVPLVILRSGKWRQTCRR